MGKASERFESMRNKEKGAREDMRKAGARAGSDVGSVVFGFL